MTADPPIPLDPWHAIERARRRYGLELSPYDLRDLARRIIARRPSHVRLVAIQPDRQTEALLVEWWGRWVLLVWHPGQQRVVTFLPLDTQFPSDDYDPRGREATNGRRRARATERVG